MKLEHHKQKVASLPHFMFRMGRFALAASVVIFLSVGIGTLGYKLLANITWIDSFYMACMILTGMGPVAEMTNNGAKIFSAFYALYSGVAFLSVTAVFFAPIIHRVLHILHVEDGEAGK